MADERGTSDPNNEAALARAYAEAAEGDTHHQLMRGGRKASGKLDPTLTPDFDNKAVSSTETAHPDPLAIERPGGATEWDAALMRGLEPGETSSELYSGPPPGVAVPVRSRARRLLGKLGLFGGITKEQSR